MHTETSTTTATKPPAAESQLIGAGERKGLHYELHMHGPTSFSFRVTRWNPGGFQVLLHESSPEHPHRGRAEMAAERWIDANAIEETPEAEASPPAPANEPATKITVAGWLLQLGDDKGGTYRVDLVDATTGEVHDGTEEFRGYMSRDQALAEAQRWAQENLLRATGEWNNCTWTVYRTSITVDGLPGWTFDVSYPTGAGDRGTFEGRLIYVKPDQALDAARSWCERFRIGAELPGEHLPEHTVSRSGGEGGEGVEALESAVEPAPAPEPATIAVAAPAPAPAPAPTQAATPAADQAIKGLVLDFEEHAEVAQQWHGLTLEIVDLEEQLKSLKADLKAKMLQRDLLAGRMSKGILAIASGRSAGPYQARLPLAAATQAARAPMTQPQLAAAAEKAAHEIEGPEHAWAFNGVDHIIRVSEVSPGSWRAALRGHEDKTEAFDPDRAAAIEACKQRASIVFQDAEPGSTAIPDPPKKRGLKKKDEVAEEQPAAEESADAPRVIAALRISMDLDEAAKKLKITTPTLQKWAAENGVHLSEHLGAELGKDEPAPTPAEKPKRGRGRKAK